MRLPPGGSLKDLGLADWNPEQTPGPLARLAWRMGFSPARPALHVERAWPPELRNISGVVDSRAARPAAPGHLINCDVYQSRPFLAGQARDLVMLRMSSGVLAAGGGLIDEFNVGGAEHAPGGLVEADLAAVRQGRIERVPGLSIPFCHYGYQAFGHFVLDGLLQVWLFRDALASGEAKLVHWPLAAAWMEPLLDRCGVPASARRVLSGPAACFERAGVSSALAGHGVYFPDAFSIEFFGWLRQVLAGGDTPQAGANGRIYVRRAASDARPVVNQDALEAFLVTRGFTILDPAVTDVAGQAQAIASSEILVAPWGSGLTLAPLLGGARRVVDLTPDTTVDQWFLRQAAIHGLAYWPVLHATGPNGEIVADLAEIERALA